jgi:UDP-glucuronate 4-epimerase
MGRALVRILITGAAGFIGSHIAEANLKLGHEVIGIDSFTPYYGIDQKLDNLSGVRNNGAFRQERLDLGSDELDAVLEGVDVIYHEAAQPGVRPSWDEFDMYVRQNVMATHRLLQAAVRNKTPRLVYASSSSVYGNPISFPTKETDLTQPTSPYGVTKLAAEHLVRLFGLQFGLTTISLRYFTVYGPRQRPDMAIHRLIETALFGGTFPLYGDGNQVRDFTYVDDVVAANLLAGSSDPMSGQVINIAGGSAIALTDLIALVERLTGSSVQLNRQPAMPEQPAETSKRRERTSVGSQKQTSRLV